MRFKGLNNSLLILFVSLVMLSLIVSFVGAKPVEKNPGTSWPSGTLWGTNLRFENDTYLENVPYVGQAWFGTRASQLKVGAAPDPPDGLVCEFYDGSKWAIWVKVPAANENWPVRLRTVGAAPSSGTLRSTMENADTLFVPQDYSVVLENTDISLRVNLRKENKFIESLPVLATLYVDNAVNIENIDNLDPLIGAAGDPLRLNVYIKNTGRYTDNYTLSAGGSIDPTILNLAPDNTDNVILTTTYPSGTENIVITAAGNYATDQAYITATGTLKVSISPENLNGLRGWELSYTVTVVNGENMEDNFILENLDDLGWSMVLDNTRFDNVPQGENRTTMLHVTIPDNAIPDSQDHVIVSATSQVDNTISADATCTARLAIVTLEASISPSIENGIPGDNLTYILSVTNTTTDNVNFKDNYNLTISDNSGWSPSLSDNRIENFSPGENGTSTFMVTIPENASAGTADNITITAVSQADNNVSGNASCIANSSVLAFQVSITPDLQEDFRGAVLNYGVEVTNTGTIADNYVLAISDNTSPSWNPVLNDNEFNNVQPGEIRNTTFSVTVSWYSPPRTDDNIRVIATSAENTNVSVENSCIARSELTEIQIYSTDDVYVSENTPDINHNLKNSYTSPSLSDSLYVGRLDNGAVRSFIKFESSIDGSTIEKALLYLLTYDPQESPPGGISPNGGENVRCYGVNNDNWSESTITWSNKPLIDGFLSDNLVDSNFTWYSWDVENFLAGAFGSDNKASFSMIGAGENNSPDHWARFHEEEFYLSGNEPYLAISYISNKDSMLVSISPKSGDNYRGDTLNYTVTVMNIGWENNSYSLTASDRTGWSLGLSSSSLENIKPGENKTATLTVTIPENTLPGTFDKVKVTATSADNNSVNYSAIAIAHDGGFWRPSVSISPLENSARPGENATFAVTLTNQGTYTDTYDLTVSDNSGWSLALSDNLLENVENETSEVVTLSVLILDNSAAGTRDNILVKATSKENPQVQAVSSCVARTASFFRRVGVSITPSQRENLPGENLTFTVTVTNRGNVRDNFLLTVDDNAGWAPTLSAPWVGWLDNGESENVVLRVRIPDNAVSSTIENISVAARSKYDDNTHAENSCIVNVAGISNRGVKVTISPGEKTGAPGESLKFNVTIKNTGLVEDNYSLTVSDDAGWGATLSATNATITAGGSDNFVASVTVPNDAVEGESTLITVTAGGTGYENSATCTAIAVAKPEGGSLILLIIIVVIIVIAIGAAIALLLIKR